MIVKDYQPYSIVEDEGFVNLLKVLAPKYKVPNRKLLTKIVDDKYSTVVECVKTKIKQKDLTMTADIWTDSHTTRSYLGVTCHFLDLAIGTNLQEIDLGVYILNERHSSAYISSCFEDILKHWAISKEQISLIVTDHAANMLKSVADTFSDDKHIGCVAHAMNLVAKKSIETTKSLPELIEKIKRIVAFFRRSTIATDQLHKLQMADGTRKSPLRMTSFVPTRWNSEFDMIERFLELYQYIQIIMTDQDRAAEMIKVEEKRNLEDVVKLLQPLHEVTEDLSGESYATVSRVLPIINCLNNCISSIKPTSPIGRILQTALQREIESRFGAYRDSPVYGPSMFLDPRFKEVHFKTSGQRDKATEIIIDMVLPEGS
nr:zinc finger BED domain-containing protein 1-like [Aedes albopictus]